MKPVSIDPLSHARFGLDRESARAAGFAAARRCLLVTVDQLNSVSVEFLLLLQPEGVPVVHITVFHITEN